MKVGPGKRSRFLLAGPVLTIPNALSVLRIFLLPPFLHYSILFEKHPERVDLLLINLSLIVFGMLTDFLDGFIARVFNQKSPLGQYLDPVSDKVVTIGAFYILVTHYSYPAWMFLYYLFRELLGTLGGSYLFLKHRILGKPNWWGKWGVALVGLSVFWYIPQPYLHLHLPGDHILLKPWISVYFLGFVLTGGVIAYARTYLPVVFMLKRN